MSVNHSKRTVRSGAASAQDRSDVAAYVAALSRDLRDLALRNDLTTLAYLLDMAQLEAETEARAETAEDAS